jgi:aerobic-type carbon monoxide dehydrogenase small subunit (CoxS/CutS family)
MKKKIKCEHGKCKRSAIVVENKKFYCADCYLFAKGINLRNVKAINDTNNSRRIH